MKVWKCCRVDCTIPQSDPLDDLNNKMSLLLNNFSELATKDEFQTVNTNILSMNDSLQKVFARLVEIEPR